MTAVHTPSTSVSPPARRLWSHARGPLLAVAVLLMAGLALAALRSGDREGYLDPRSATPQGSRAAAELLRERGVDTTVVSSTAEATAAARADTTLLVARPDLLTTRQRHALRDAVRHRGGRTVLVSPGPDVVRELAPGVRASPPTRVVPRSPDCELPAARRAGEVELGGFRYTTPVDDSDGCYASEGLPTLLRLSTENSDTVLLGSPQPLFNERLAHHGNASLTLHLLGSRPHLVWYLPSLGDSASADGRRSFYDLIPTGWYWGTLQLGIAAVLAALWRSRRLGPLVVEHLPVTIRASETTEGRARLYRRANARDRAAEVLRAAVRRRLTPLVGIPLADAHRPEVLCAAVAAHVTDDIASVSALLFGPAPRSDAALVQLVDDLDRLEHRIAPLLREKDHTP